VPITFVGGRHLGFCSAHSSGDCRTVPGGLKLFVVETRDGGAMLVPAETASAEPEAAKAAPKTRSVAGRVPAEVADRACALAASRGETMSMVIAAVLTEYVAAHV
jgi:hypothetical protein